MKFIPSSVLERMNSLLQGIEAQGSLLTVRCEAYTCRYTKEEKQLAATIGDRRQQQQQQQAGSVSPILQPSTASAAYVHGHFPPMEGLPPPAMVSSTATAGGIDMHSQLSPQSGAVDDRLIFLVAALNAVFGDGYDFSCLEESDFDLLDPLYTKTELENVLASIPSDSAASSVIGPPFQHDAFWAAIADVAFGDRSAVANLFDGSCDFFLFKCPGCDPMHERSVWSNHVLVYCKRQRILVSILAYGEGNLYRGDDGVHYRGGSSTAAAGFVSPSSRVVGGEFYFDGDTTHYLRPSSTVGSAIGDDYSQTTSVTEDHDEDPDMSTNKNRDYYGF